MILLKDPDYFNIPADKVGRANADVMIITSIACLLVWPFYGYIFELFGRVCPLTVGPICVAVMNWFVPKSAPSFIFLCFVRSFAGLFTGFCIMNPLIADYVKSESRGLAAAFAMIGILIGGAFGMIVYLEGTKEMNLQESFNFVSFTMALLASLNYWFVREPIIKSRKKKSDEAAVHEQR